MRPTLLALALCVATPAAGDTGDTGDTADTGGLVDTGDTGGVVDTDSGLTAGEQTGTADGAADLVGDPGGAPSCGHVPLVSSVVAGLIALAAVGRRRAT